MKNFIIPLVVTSVMVGILTSCTISTDPLQQDSSRKNTKNYSGQTLPEGRFGSGRGMGRMRGGSGRIMMGTGSFGSGNVMRGSIEGSGRVMMGTGGLGSGEHMGSMMGK